MTRDEPRAGPPDTAAWVFDGVLRVLPLPLWWLALRSVGAHDDAVPLWQLAGMVLQVGLGTAGAASGAAALVLLLPLSLVAAGHAWAGAAEPWALLLAGLSGAFGPGFRAGSGGAGEQGTLLRRVAALALPAALLAWTSAQEGGSAAVDEAAPGAPAGAWLAGRDAANLLEHVAWTWLAVLGLLGLLQRSLAADHAAPGPATIAGGSGETMQGRRIQVNPLLWLAAEFGDAWAAWLLLPPALGAPVALLRLLTGRGAALAREVGGHITHDLLDSPLARADSQQLRDQGRWVARQLAVGIALVIGALGPHGWTALGGGALDPALAWAVAAGALATAPVRHVAPIGLLAAGTHAAVGVVGLVVARPTLQLAVRALQRVPGPNARALRLTGLASAPGLAMAATLGTLAAPAHGGQLTMEVAAVLVVHAVASVATWHLGVRARS